MRQLVESRGHAEVLAPLADKWLGTFDIYSFHVGVIEPGTTLDCYAAVLQRLCREYGYVTRGVISMRKSRERYLVQQVDGMARDELPIEYVGRYSYFSGHSASLYAPSTRDKVFIQPLVPSISSTPDTTPQQSPRTSITQSESSSS